MASQPLVIRPPQEKQRIAYESYGTTIAKTAKKYGLSETTVFNWRKRFPPPQPGLTTIAVPDDLDEPAPALTIDEWYEVAVVSNGMARFVREDCGDWHVNWSGTQAETWDVRRRWERYGYKVVIYRCHRDGGGVARRRV